MALITSIIGFFTLLAGLVICFLDKGTKKHMFWGRVYSFSLLLLVVFSFILKKPNDFLGAYLIFLLISAILVVSSIVVLILRHGIKLWVVWHYILMLYSFLLLAIGICSVYLDHFTQLLTNQKMVESEANVVSRIIFWFLPFIIGTIWIFAKKRNYESKFMKKMMRPNR